MSIAVVVYSAVVWRIFFPINFAVAGHDVITLQEAEFAALYSGFHLLK